MKFSMSLLPRWLPGCAAAIFALSLAPGASAAILFSEDFDAIPAGNSISTSNSSFNTAVSISGHTVVAAADNPAPVAPGDPPVLFSPGPDNRYLHFEDSRSGSGSANSARIAGGMSESISAGLFQFSFDMHFPGDTGTATDIRLELTSSSANPSGSNRVLQLLLRNSLPTGSRVQIPSGASLPVIADQTYRIDIIGNRDTLGSIDYSGPDFSVAAGTYDVLINGVREAEGISLLSAAAISHFNITSPNAPTGVVYFDNFLMRTGDDISIVARVPEPTSVALAGLAIVGLAALRRRMR